MFWRSGWRFLGLCAVALTVGLLSLTAYATTEAGPQGDWLTENGRGVVQIERCGDALCGRIVGIDTGPAQSMPTDAAGHPQCGLTIISGEKPDDAGTWLGKITDPRDGDSYQAKLWVDPRGELRMRVFIGIPALGATQVWHRFTGRLSGDCRFA